MSQASKNILNFEHTDDVSVISMDDGKANAMSPAMLKALNEALDKAEAKGGVVILTGREKMFSGGFDLSIFKQGSPEEIYTMLSEGAQLAHRLLSFPLPTICACSGHAIAMGVFTLLASDYRIGLEGDSKFAANEVAIGLTLPHFALETLRQRLTPQHLNKAVNFAWYFSAQEAITAGFLDELSSPEALLSTAHERARATLKLDLNAHRESKLRLRAGTIQNMEKAIALDCAGWKKDYKA